MLSLFSDFVMALPMDTIHRQTRKHTHPRWTKGQPGPCEDPFVMMTGLLVKNRHISSSLFSHSLTCTNIHEETKTKRKHLLTTSPTSSTSFNPRLLCGPLSSFFLLPSFDPPLTLLLRGCSKKKQRKTGSVTGRSRLF